MWVVLLLLGGNPIIGPTGGQPGDIILLDASQAKAKAYAWECIPLNTDAAGKPLVTIVALGDKAIVSSRPGTRTVILSVLDESNKLSLYQWPITIGGPPPVPPGPGPSPPGPGPAPAPGTGFHALVIRESGDAGRVDAVFAKSVRDYLDAKAKGKWRVWDDDSEFAPNVNPVLRDMHTRFKGGQLPVLVIQPDGQSPVSLPLPKDADALLAELRKWGG